MSIAWGTVDGIIQSLDTIGVSPLSEGFQYGLGVFSTLRVHQGRVVCLDWHQRRLVRDAEMVGIRYETSATLEERCRSVIGRNSLVEDGLKVIVYVDQGLVRELVIPRRHPYVLDPSNPRSLLVLACNNRRGDGRGRAKSLNYQEHLLALRDARSRGFDDALWVDESGAILETATSNVFIVREGEILTPPPAEGILRGTTRDLLLECSGTLKFRETPIPQAWLDEAEEVFVTNALGGVMPVIQIGQRRLTSARNSLTLRAAEVVRRAWAAK